MKRAKEEDREDELWEGGGGAGGDWESIIPVFLDGEALFPGEVIVRVVICVLGLGEVAEKISAIRYHCTGK